MTKKLRWTSAFALLLAFLTAGSLLAGKGGKNPPPADPPPPGTIYFDQSTGYPTRDTLGMNTDGSGKFAALPAGVINEDQVSVCEPSKLLYGDKPMWLAVVDLAYPTVPVQNELFAIRSNADGTAIESVQVTNFDRGIRMDFQGARWSNDGQDTFVSFVGFSEAENLQLCLHRLNISGAELDLAFEFPELWTPLGAVDAETVFCGDDLNSHHDWSPDGSEVAYLVGSDLRVWDTVTQADRLLASGSGIPRWSPDGTRIAFSGSISNRRKVKHGIVTIEPNGANATLLIEGGSYNTPHWSPDGGFLAVSVWRIVQGGSDFTYDIARVKADGSGLTFLTDDLDPLAGKRLLGWRE